MKAVAFAIAAGSIVSSAIASPHDRHMAFHNRRNQDLPPFPIVPRSEEACGCTTYTTWVTAGPGGLYTPSSSHTTSIESTIVVTPSPIPTTPATVPTPAESTFTSTGTYTVTGTSTITLTTTHTAPSPTSTVCEGTCTYGGVTTSVVTETTVTCPYATTSVTGGVTTSIITSTTYTCPSGGEYTIIPHTTVTVPSTSTISYPTTTHYPPGTYTQPTTTLTVTKTSETFTCPYETVHPTPAPAPTTHTVSPPEYTTTPSPKPKPSPKPYPGPSTNGNQWAMTYTPYSSSGGCKSAGEVMSDIQKIHGMGFTTVRTYSTDCSTLQFVGNACKAAGMKMIIGIFIDESGIGGAQSQLHDILSWGQWDLVESAVVGNEAIFNGYTQASELAGFIGQVKGALQGAGLSVPVTTTEPVDIMQQYGSALCGAMDIMGVNVQPFFDATVSAASAGEFVVSQMEMAGKVCPGLEVYNFECGWPNAGSPNGAAHPGTAEQAQAIKSIVEKAGKNTAIFSASDDPWKTPGEFNVEQFFGAASCFS